MKYSDQIRNGNWYEKRDNILRRDNYKCRICGSKEQIQVHHLAYEGLAWQVRDSDLITVCDKCHEDFENDKKLKEENILLPVDFTDELCESLYTMHLKLSGQV